MLLEATHLLGHSPLGNAKIVCRRAEAQMSARRYECPEAVQGR